MRRAILILVIVLGSTTALGGEPGAFTGFWKGNCKDAFGLQIMPNGEIGQYSVSFCGPGGCFEPGTYRPLTTIENDPAYKVLDDDHIMVRGRGGSWNHYYKCTEDTHPKLRYKSNPYKPKNNDSGRST